MRMAKEVLLVRLVVLLDILLCMVPQHSASAIEYNIVALGARGDGKTDSSKALQSAWSAACGHKSGATIYVPPGKFYVGYAAFNGPCKNSNIEVRIDGTLVAPSNYNVIGNMGSWIIFRFVNGVSIYGGTLDGQGSGLWTCKASGKVCPNGAANLEISNSQNVLVRGLRSLNSQVFHIVLNGCQNVKLQGVKVLASGKSPNTDGIHIGTSTGITILNTKIGTGDDCISIGPGTHNLWIENIACGPGHGISIGSLGKEVQEDGVQNVTVKTVQFKGTQNGVRIKTWARPSTAFVRNILFQHAVMTNVQNPIIIDQNYCPDNIGCSSEASGVRVSDITYQDIHGSSATKVAVKFDCSAKYPCTGIKLENVKLTYKNQVAAASCSHAGGTASGLVQPASCL